MLESWNGRSLFAGRSAFARAASRAPRWGSGLSVPGLAASCLAVVVLAGCGDDATLRSDSSGRGMSADASRIASASNSKSTSSATRSSPSPSSDSKALVDPFVIPGGAQTHDQAGARAFLEHFYAAMHAAYTLPQGGVLASKGLPGCSTCSVMERQVGDLIKRGHRYQYESSTVSEVAIDPESTADQVLMSYVVTDTAGQELDEAGRIVKALPRQESPHTILLVWTAGAWKVEDVGAPK